MSVLEKIISGDVYFVSNIFKRYENGIAVTNSFAKSKRAIKIERNPQGKKGYWLTIYNLEGTSLPIFNDKGNNIQLTPKQMEIISKTEGIIVLKGWDDEHSVFTPPVGSIVYDGGGNILPNAPF